MTHDRILNTIMNGITVQHVGELLNPGLRPNQPNLHYPKTLRKCLEDFVFTYLCTDSVLVTSKLPPVGSNSPGRALVDQFGDFFQSININLPYQPEDLLGNPMFKGDICRRLGVFGKAARNVPPFFEEFVQREAAASFGSHESVYTDSSTDDMSGKIYGKDPVYMFCPELQRLVDDSTIDGLESVAFTVLKSNKKQDQVERLPTNKAVREFVSRIILTHVVIDIWYEKFFKDLVDPRAIILPHVTRAELDKAVIREMRKAMIPYVMTDVVLETPGNTPEAFIDRLRFLRKYSDPYQRMRRMFSEVMALDLRTQEKRADWILRQIAKIANEAKLPQGELDLNFGNWAEFFRGSIRFKVAYQKGLRSIVEPNKFDRDSYSKALYEIFDGLDPKIASGKAFSDLTQLHIERIERDLIIYHYVNSSASRDTLGNQSQNVTGNTVGRNMQVTQSMGSPADLKHIEELLLNLHAEIQKYHPSAKAELDQLSIAAEAARKRDPKGVAASLKDISRWVFDFAAKITNPGLTKFIEQLLNG